MKYIFLLVLLFNTCALHAMKKSKSKHEKLHKLGKPKKNKHAKAGKDAQTFALQAFKEAAQAFGDKELDQNHLRRAGVCAELALSHQYEDAQQELAAIKEFDMGVQALIKNELNDAAQSCVHIIDNRPYNSELLKKIRTESFSLMMHLADERKHTLSRFYIMKHLLNSSVEEQIKAGLDRFDTLDTQHMNEADAKALSVFFKHFEVVEDVKRLANEKSNSQAQCALSELCLYQAVQGKDMSGEQIDVKGQLVEALNYAKCAKKAQYLKAVPVIKAIRETSVELYEQSKIDAPLSVVDPRQPLPDALKAALNVYKEVYKQDSVHLCQYGKKLTENSSDEAHQLGINFLTDALKLGSPFAAELLGDALHHYDPDKALLYYCKSIDMFKSAPSQSRLHFIGKLKLATLLNKMSAVARHVKEESPYLQAIEIGYSAALDKNVHGICNPNMIEDLAGLIHACEAEFATSQSSVDTLTLEMLNTSGVLRYMEDLKEFPEIQSVVVEALSLRGKLGRGFILKDKSALAHLRKALHFIIDPADAADQPFNNAVSDDILIRKIKIDSLPIHQRILYLHGMVGILERMILTQDTLTPKEINFACNVFVLCSQAMTETKDAHLWQSHKLTFSNILGNMASLALASKSTTFMQHVANALYIECTSGPFGTIHLESAEKLYEQVLLIKNQSIKDFDGSVFKKKLGKIKRLRAELAYEQEDTAKAISLFSDVLKLNPEDTHSAWQLSQILLKCHERELRIRGVKVLQKLADSFDHIDALICMGRGLSHGGFNGLVDEDLDKAIGYYQRVVKKEDKSVPGIRGVLAEIYFRKSKFQTGYSRKKLLAKAHDLIVKYKKQKDDIHVLFLDIINDMGQVTEIIHEIESYQPQGDRTIVQINELAQAYFIRIQKPQDKLRAVMLKKIEDLLAPIRTASDTSYILYVKSLVEQLKFKEAEQECAQETKPHLHCIRKTIRASMALYLNTHAKFEEFVSTFDQAFEEYDEYFVRKSLTDTEDLLELLQAIPGTRISLTHPMKQCSLIELEGVCEQMTLLLQGYAIKDPKVRNRMIAYHAYFNLKLNLVHYADSIRPYKDVISS